MSINFEKTPSVIFDWIETYAFAELDNSQKRVVLHYFSEEEYEDMRRTALSLKSGNDAHSLQPGHHRKKEVLSHFDRHHAFGKERTLFSRKMIVWQAAAILLMLLSGWLFYQVFDLKKNAERGEMASTDTVYVDREVKTDPQIIHDTVFKYKEVKAHHKADASPDTAFLEPEDIDRTGDMDELQSIELENLNTTPRGNSMKDDSLLRKFGFISM